MRQFGHYRIEGLLGVGGMGEVHRAHDTRRDREVALKLLPAALGSDPEYQKRFQRESYTAARLREPHVIPIHDYGEIDNQLYIDMRLVDGRSLAALLAEEGALPPARAVALVGQVAEALDAAHASGLVHRDIKPSNILVTASDFVYVVDFGVAHVTGQTHAALTVSGATVGTLDYMAPERFENRPVDPRTDVYSLACVLFECLTARRPFVGNDLPSLMYAHLFTEPPQPSQAGTGVSPVFDAVIAKGMAKNADERFTSAGALAAAASGAVAVATTDAFAMRPLAQPGPPPPAPMPANGQPTSNLQLGPPIGPPPAQHLAGPATPPRRGTRRTVIALAAVAIVAVLVAAGVMVVAFRDTGGPTFGPALGAPLDQGPRAVANSVAKPTVGATFPVGPTPGYIEIAPNGTYGYVANRAAGVVSVIDPARNAVLGTIAVPKGGAQFVAFSPDGARAYVSIFSNDRTFNVVGVLDTATNQWIAEVPVGVRPFALDITSDGKSLYVPNHDSGSISVIDTATNTVRTTIQVAPHPHWVDVSPDDTRLYAANHESNLVSVIDIATDTVLATIPVGTSPHSIVKLAQKPIVLVCNYDSSSVSVIDTDTNTVTKTVAVGAHPQDVSLSADGKYAYIVTVDQNAIQVLDTAKLEITATVPTGQSPTAVAVAPEGRQAYVTNLNDGSVTVINIAGTA